MHLKSILLVVTLAAGPVLAEGHGQVVNDIYVGDRTHNPNSNALVHAYAGANYCPQGLQPVTIGGVICCGEPNAGAYVDSPGATGVRPMSVAVEGEKGVIYR